MTTSEIDILITHFLSPHMFWYRIESNLIDETLYDLELRIQDFYLMLQQKCSKNRYNIQYQPKIKEMVAVFNVSDNRWIRAEVDQIYEFGYAKTKYILWAIDYGKPFLSTSNFIRELPSEFAAVEIGSIKLGGLNEVVPAENSYDFMLGQSKMIVCKKWSEKSCELATEIIENAYTCTFTKKNFRDGQSFGELKITTNMKHNINLKKILIESSCAIEKTDNFFAIFDEYNLGKSERWLTQSGNCNLFKFNRNALDAIKLNNLEQIQEKQKLKEISKENDEDEELLVENQIAVEKKVQQWREQNEILSADRNVPTNDKLKSKIIDIEEKLSTLESVSVIGQNQKLNLLRDLELHNDDTTIENLTKKPILNDDQSILLIGRSHTVDKCFELKPKLIDQTVKIYDNKSIVSTASTSVSRLSEIQKKRIMEAKKRLNKSNDEIKQITNEQNIPAGFDLSQLHKKNSPNKSENNDKTNIDEISSNISTVSNQMANIRRIALQRAKLNQKNQVCESEKLKIMADDNKNLTKPLNKPTISVPEMKFNNIKNNVKNQFTDKSHFQFQKINERVKVDRRLQDVNEVCLPNSTLGRDSVLVHGTIPKPINKISDANFTSRVKTEMELLRYNSIYRIQQYAWPHLFRLNSLILINGSKTGKTFSYLPVVCSLIQLRKDDEEIHDGVGPIAIIIVPFQSEAQQLFHLCRRFVSSVVLCTNLNNCVEAVGHLQKGADILICTLDGINLLLNNEIKCFEKHRIRHLVIENLDSWSNEKRVVLVKEVLKKFKSQNIQVIVTSRIWDPLIQKLIKYKLFSNPLLCIGALIEAAVYAKTNFQLKIINKIEKIQHVSDFIQKHPFDHEKLIIVCSCDDEAELVSQNLQSISHYTRLCTKNSTSEEIRLTSNDWYNSDQQFILICTDDILCELEIRNAQNLIHYSLSSSWTRTCFRFSVFLKTYADRIKKVEQKLRINSLIFLDETNNEQLPKLVKFLERNNIQIHPAITNLVKQIEIEREKLQNSENRMLCSKWLEFGTIHDKFLCSNRHVLKTIDVPLNSFPTNGVVEIQIIGIESPVHYRVRVLKYKTPNQSWCETQESNKFVLFNMEFTKYFLNFDNHQTYYPIMLNDFCVVLEKEKYYRGKVTKVVTMKNRPNDVTEVQIKLIDIGLVKPFKTIQLLALPNKFKDFPAQAVDLFLTDIVPYDNEDIWDRKSTDTVKNWFAKNPSDRIIAYIDFTLNNIIFAKEILLQNFLNSIETYVEKLYIKKNLITKAFVKKIEVNNDIKQIVNELSKSLIEKTEEKKCSSSDFSKGMLNTSFSSSDISFKSLNNSRSSSERARPRRRILEINDNSENQQTQESWETLNSNEFTNILISNFISPDEFYVTKLYVSKKLSIFYKMIDDFIINNAKEIINPAVGLNCLAEYKGFYNRCKIIELMFDSCEIITAKVFFNDIGIFNKLPVNKLMTTSNEIISTLPNQAIKCSLFGILPNNLNEFWSETNCDEIYDKIEKYQNLYVRPIIKDLTPKQNNDNILKYWKYEIILVDCSTEIDVQINDLIVDLGWATKNPVVEHNFEEINSMLKLKKTDAILKMETDSDSISDSEDNLTDESHNMNNDGFSNEDDFNEFYNDVLKFLEPIMDDDETSENDKKIVEISKSSSNVQQIENKNENEKLFQLNDEKLIKNYEIPSLKSIYKGPNVIWQQSEDLINLSISAPDIKDYFLEVTNCSLLFATVIDAETLVRNINFFGCIDESLTSHEIRGLNVTVRLVKRFRGKVFKWPRLTNETDKHYWLKYNYEAIILDYENEIFSKNISNGVLINNNVSNNYDSSDESDLELETFNRIEDPEDDYDFLADF